MRKNKIDLEKIVLGFFARLRFCNSFSLIVLYVYFLFGSLSLFLYLDID